jgi:rRNA maturation endonuclease Nob1
LQASEKGKTDLPNNAVDDETEHEISTPRKVQSPAMASVFCTQCGEKADPQDTFCSNCGNELKKY